MVTEARLAKIKRVLSHRQGTACIVMENVHDPHNVSAVLRSCDATGIPEVHLLYHSGTDFPELAKSSSSSAVKWMPTIQHNSVAECYEHLRSRGFKILTTHLSADAVSLYDTDLTEPVALVFGNEHEGVSEEAVAKADGNIVIPQVGMIQSLNISVACAVSVYELYRQRDVKGMYDEVSLPQETYERRLKLWSDNHK